MLISAHTTVRCEMQLFCAHRASCFPGTSGSWKINHLLCKGATYMEGKGSCTPKSSECMCKPEAGFRFIY